MERKFKGIQAFSIRDWEEYGEFNVDFDELQRTMHIQLRLTPREHYLLCHYALKQKKKVSLHESIHILLARTGIFECVVEPYTGAVDYSELKKVGLKKKPTKKRVLQKDKRGKLYRKKRYIQLEIKD